MWSIQSFVLIEDSLALQWCHDWSSSVGNSYGWEEVKNVQKESVEDKNLSKGKNNLSQLPMITLGRNIETLNKYIPFLVHSLTWEKNKLMQFQILRARLSEAIYVWYQKPFTMQKVCLFLMITNYSLTLKPLECENQLINYFTSLLLYYLLCLLDWLITLSAGLSMKSMKAVLWRYMVRCAPGIFEA